MGISIVRALARLLALGALLGAAVLLLIASITTPVVNAKGFDFVNAMFVDGSSVRLGAWGGLYTSSAGATTSTGTSFGYNLVATTVPGYSANPGTAPIYIVQKMLSSALIFLPLAVGANLLALLGALIPIRIVTIITLVIVFLAVGASAIGFTIVVIIATRAVAQMSILFNPRQLVNAEYGWATWFVLAALVCDVGALLFLLIAMPPGKPKPIPPAELGLREKYVGTDYGLRRDSEKAWAGRPFGAGSTGVRNGSIRNASVYGGYPERERESHRSSRRSRRGDDIASSRPRSTRSRRDSLTPTEDDYEERRSSRRSEKRRRRDESDDEGTVDGYRSSRRDDGGYVGY